MITTGNNNRVSYISIGSGSCTISGNLTMGSNALRNYITFSGSGTLNLGGSITGGDIIPGTGTVNYNGTTAQSVIMNSTYVYNNLYLNNPAGAALSAAISATRVLGDVRVQSGVFSNSGYGIVGNTGKTFEVANGATLQLGGTTSAFPTVFTPSLGATSTVEYKGSGNQTVTDIASPGYGNLILSNGGTKAVAVGDGLDIQGDITLNSGITFNLRTYVHNIQGNWFNDGGTVSGNCTINFNGSNQAIDGSAPTQSFYKIILANNTMLYCNCGFTLINSTTTINTSCKLIIPAGNQVTATGNITNNAGTSGITIESDAGGTGSLIHPNANVQATVQRYVDAANWATWDDGWHFLSSPVSAQAISGTWTPTGTGNDYDFYLWNEPTTEWVNIKNTSTPPLFTNVNPGSNFVVGRGYEVAYQLADTKVFSGNMNVANVTKSGLSLTSSGWHLLGNPYSCALIWLTGWTYSNVSAVCQYWDGITNSYYPLTAGQIIPAMNGFMVQALVNNASITIPKAARTHSTTPWYKNAATGSNSIKLMAWEEGKHRGKVSIVTLDPNSTTGFDPDYDGHYLADNAPKFYSLAGNDQLSVNTLPELGNDVRIPFVFAKNTASNFTIELDAENAIPGLTIFLTDNKTGVETNLSQNPVYEFSAADGDDINRFVLHFLSTTGTTPSKENNSMQVYASDNTLHISQSLLQSGKVYLFSLTGQLVNAYDLKASPSQSIGLPQLAPGVYMVNIKTNTTSYNQKIVIR